MYENKPNRLREYDYSTSGYYFITACTKKRIHYFGEIINARMVLNKCGEIIYKQWIWLGKQYDYIALDSFVIMPDHIHGIIYIDSSVGMGRDPYLRRKTKSLSELIGAFKTTSSKKIHNQGFHQFQWQQSFYDHIIRNEESLNVIREYIIENPLRWQFKQCHSHPPIPFP